MHGVYALCDGTALILTPMGQKNAIVIEVSLFQRLKCMQE